MSDVKGMQEPTSLKEAFQGIMTESMSMEKGKVVRASPVAVEMLNDEKMVASGDILVVPWHLTDYETTCDITATAVEAVTVDGEGKHGHSGTEASGSDGQHTHTLRTFSVTGASITMHNSLKVGEMVDVISFNSGKKYYVLDRAEGSKGGGGT